jgi:hypothetical protein
MDKLIKDGIKTLENMQKEDLNLTELCIHMETSTGEILEVDIELDSFTGEILKEHNLFKDEDDYAHYLEVEQANIPDEDENILYN